MQIGKKEFYDLIAKRKITIHIPQPFKCCRIKMLIASLCAFFAEDSLL